MQVFEIVIGLLLGGTILAALARRFGTPYPALLALAGTGLALIPGVPTLVLDPELALALFVAPVLLDSAFDASQRDLRTNWRSVTSLALGAVVLTVAAVGSRVCLCPTCHGPLPSRSVRSLLHPTRLLLSRSCANSDCHIGC